jgi:NitT/TauT family transport system substrate-binding protein
LPWICFIRKKNIKLLLLSHRDGSIFVKNKRANIGGLKDFKNKMVLIPFNASMHHILLHQYLQKEGMSVGLGKDVITEVAAPTQIPMMIEWDTEGSIAGYIAPEPFGTQVISSGLGEQITLSKDIMPNHPCCVVVVKDDVIAKNPEAVQEFISSLVESGKSVFTDVENSIQAAVEFLGQTEAVMRAVLTDPNHRVSMDKLMPKAEEFQFIQDYLIDTVDAPALSTKINVNDFLDLSFAKTAGAV